MRTLLVILLLLLICSIMGCNDRSDTNETGSQYKTSKGTSTGTQAGAVEYPAQSVDFLIEAMKNPVKDGNPPLEPVWLGIAELDYLVQSESVSAIKSAVIDMVVASGENPLPMLSAAWLKVEPQKASDFIRERVWAGDLKYLDASWYEPGLCRELLAELNIIELSSLDAKTVLNLVSRLEPHLESDLDVLKQLATHCDVYVRYKAQGLLVGLDSSCQEQFDSLFNGVRMDSENLAHAAEGIRVSRVAELSDALVPLAAQVELGDEDPEAKVMREPLFASYALAYLPGEQAQLMRSKLIGAKSPLIRWQTRLGELLNGNPDYWDKAVAKVGIENHDIWVAIEPPEAVHPDLITTYQLAVEHEDPLFRARTASHLNRYKKYSSNQRVIGIIETLLDDSNFEVQALAWYSVADLKIESFYDKAITVVEDSDQPGELRVAAAVASMILAEEISADRRQQ